MLYLEMFISFLQIGLFSFGGGYAAVPLIQSQIVEKHGWLAMSEFADLVTIAEMTPGPIAVNSATFVGQRLAGFPGALVCTFGCILPSFIIVLLLAWLYFKFRSLKTLQGVLTGLRPAVVSMIAGAGCSILMLALFNADIFSFQISDFRVIEAALFVICLFLLRKFKLNPILIIFGSGVAGTLCYLAIG